MIKESEEKTNFSWLKASDFLEAKLAPAPRGWERDWETLWLAVCHRTGHVAFVESEASQWSLLTIFIVRDAYITNNQCEEGTSCLNLSCPLNKTTSKSFKQRHDIKSKKPINFDLFSKLDLSSLIPKASEPGVIALKEKILKKKGAGPNRKEEK